MVLAKSKRRKWLSITEAARHAGIDRTKLLRAIKQGKIRATRVGWVYLVNLRALDEYRRSL